MQSVFTKSAQSYRNMIFHILEQHFNTKFHALSSNTGTYINCWFGFLSVVIQEFLHAFIRAVFRGGGFDMMTMFPQLFSLLKSMLKLTLHLTLLLTLPYWTNCEKEIMNYSVINQTQSWFGQKTIKSKWWIKQTKIKTKLESIKVLHHT